MVEGMVNGMAEKPQKTKKGSSVRGGENYQPREGGCDLFCVVPENRANGFGVKRIVLIIIMAKTISVTIVSVCSVAGVVPARACVCLQARRQEPGGPGC